MAHTNVCPTGGPAHGPLVGLAANPRWGFHCPHQDHDGRPKTHPDGEAPSTRHNFTTAEVDAAAKARGALTPPATLPAIRRPRVEGRHVDADTRAGH